MLNVMISLGNGLIDPHRSVYDARCEGTEKNNLLLQKIFSSIDAAQVHSVSYGMFRLPKPFFRKMVKLYPQEKLFSMPLTEQEAQVSFSNEIEQESHGIVHNELLKYIDDSIIFPCL